MQFADLTLGQRDDADAGEAQTPELSISVE